MMVDSISGKSNVKGQTMKNLEMSTFKFVNCQGQIGEYPCNGLTYEQVTVGGLEGLLNALKETKPRRFIRLS